MGTFHNNLGELHGITVVAQSSDGTLYIGRCHQATDQNLTLLDADIHKSHTPALRDDYLKHAAKFGVFPKHKHLQIPRSQLTSITPLANITST